MRTVIYSQHVLGMGHLFRCLELARALAPDDVLLVTGGAHVDIPLPENVRTLPLPPLMMDADFKQLLPADKNGALLHVSEEELERIKHQRRERLLAGLLEFAPDILLVELYPFGRKAFAFELDPALALLRNGALPHAKAVCSLRDILVEKTNPEKYENRVLQRLNGAFDALLVHSDPGVVSLDATFSRTAEITPEVHHTGYVAPAISREEGRAVRQELNLDDSHPLIVLSAGSGGVGARVLHATVEASLLLAQETAHALCVFTGPYLPEEEYAALQTRAAHAPWVRLRRFTPGLAPWLRAADLSVSLAGYNTVMALLAAQTFGLVRTFDQNREQRMRAELLQQRGALQILEHEDLAPRRLAALMRDALNKSIPADIVDINGARSSAQVLRSLHSRGRQSA